MERVPFETRGDTGAAFVVMHAMHTPWQDDEYPNLKNVEMPITLILNRADGLIGFPGGMTDFDEAPVATALRETYEELGAELPASELRPLAAYRHADNFVVHSFEWKTDFNTLKMFQKFADSAHHFGSEITGVMLPHLVDYGELGWKGGIANLLRTPSAPSVPHEIGLLVQKIGFYGKDKIDQLSRDTGIKLDYL